MIVWVAAGYWLWLWLSAQPGSESSLKTTFPDPAVVEEIRFRFLSNLFGVSGDAEGLVAGLAIGERGLISQELAEQMQELSLTHLVAVSGANLAIVTATVFWLVARLGFSRNLRFVTAVIAMSGYVILVGPESSVLRAAAMAMFVIAGLWLGRRVSPLVMLAWAVLFLLVIDPGLAVDFGFGLSVFATTGLLLIASRVVELLEGLVHPVIALGLAGTFSAQLFTMPILLMLESTIPIYSVVANLLVEPVVAPVTILGITSASLVWFLPALTQLLTWLSSLGTWWITLVAENLSELPLTRIPYVPGPIGVGLMTATVAGVTLWMLWQGRIRSLGIALTFISVAVAVSWVTADIIRSKSFAGDWQVVNCDVGQGDALLLRSNELVALIDVGRDPEPIDRCLETLGISRINLLMLTHFDADHVGGISGAISGRKIDRALISGFKDDRPMVSIVFSALRSIGTEPEIGFRGLAGELGEVDWVVLNPTFQASEAFDSNDASLVTIFDFGDFAVLALGDLGESGQMRLIRQSYATLAGLRSKALVVKVAHHGSADQSRELYELVEPDIAIFSVGRNNDYGHPTDRAIRISNSTGAVTARTDLQGAIAIRVEAERFILSSAGKLSL